MNRLSARTLVVLVVACFVLTAGYAFFMAGVQVGHVIVAHGWARRGAYVVVRGAYVFGVVALALQGVYWVIDEFTAEDAS